MRACLIIEEIGVRGEKTGRRSRPEMGGRQPGVLKLGQSLPEWAAPHSKSGTSGSAEKNSALLPVGSFVGRFGVGHLFLLLFPQPQPFFCILEYIITQGVSQTVNLCYNRYGKPDVLRFTPYPATLYLVYLTRKPE